MKYVMAMVLVALVGCGGTKNRAPVNEPVSTTQTTSAALTTVSDDYEPHGRDMQAPNPIVAANARDRALGAKIQKHLQTSLSDVPWTRVRMEIDGGHVKLVGTLPTVADSTALEASIREVKGVTGVTNTIELPNGTQQSD